MNFTKKQDGENPSTDLIYLATPSLLSWLACLVTCIAWIFLSKPSLFPHITEYYYGGIEGDAGIYVWLVKHVQLKLTSLPWFETDAFYPYSGTLAFSDNFILPGILYALIHSAIGQEILSYNLTMLLIQLFGALAFFRLAYALTENLPSSILGSIVLLALAPFTNHLGHPQLQCFFCFPLMFYLCLRFVQRPSLFYGFLIGACISVAFLCSVYYAIFCAILVCCFFIGLLLILPGILKVKEFLILAAALIAGTLPCLPFILPYLSIKDLFGKRELFEAFAFSATPLSYISFSPFNWLFGILSSLSHSEAQLGIGPTMSVMFLFAIVRTFEGDRLYPCKVGLLGLLFILMATYTTIPVIILTNLFVTIISWLLFFWSGYSLYMLGKVEREYNSKIVTNRDIQGIILWCAVCFVLISFGPITDPSKNEFSFSPFTFLYTLFPGLSGVRAIGRAGLVFTLFIALLFTINVNLFRVKKLISPFFFTLLFTLAIVENFCDRFPNDRPLPAPPVLSKLHELTANSSEPKPAVLMLPYARLLGKNGEILSWVDFARVNVYAMNWLSELPVSLINGYSGQKTKVMKELPRRLTEFPDAGSLREIGSYPELGYIAVVPKLYNKFDSVKFEASLELFKNDLTIAQKDSEGNYLLKYTGSTKLDPAFVIKFPGSYSKITLYFSASKSCSEKLVHLKLFEDENLAPFQTVELTPDSQIHQTEIDLGALKRGIAIRRIRFQTTEDCPVFLSHEGQKIR